MVDILLELLCHHQKNLNILFSSELARDHLNHSGRYIVEKGVISIVHDAYGKKVSIVILYYNVVSCGCMSYNNTIGTL